MLKKLYDLAKLVVTFGQQTQKNQQRLDTVDNEVERLSMAVQLLLFEVQRLRDEIQHSKETQRQEYENFRLQLDVDRLRFERTLPPAPGTDGDD